MYVAKYFFDNDMSHAYYEKGHYFFIAKGDSHELSLKQAAAANSCVSTEIISFLIFHTTSVHHSCMHQT